MAVLCGHRERRGVVSIDSMWIRLRREEQGDTFGVAVQIGYQERRPAVVQPPIDELRIRRRDERGAVDVAKLYRLCECIAAVGAGVADVRASLQEKRHACCMTARAARHECGGAIG